MTTTSGDAAELLRMLEAYQHVTKQMLDFMNAREDGVLLSMEQLQDLLSERDELLRTIGEGFGASVLQLPEVQEKVQEIQQTEDQVLQVMYVYRLYMQEKMATFQQQKRGLLAYNKNPIFGAAFIDRKK